MDESTLSSLSSDIFMCANDGGGNECTENLGFAAAEKHA